MSYKAKVTGLQAWYVHLQLSMFQCIWIYLSWPFTEDGRGEIHTRKCSVDWEPFFASSLVNEIFRKPDWECIKMEKWLGYQNDKYDKYDENPLALQLL